LIGPLKVLLTPLLDGGKSVHAEKIGLENGFWEQV
jgi:hypothetical protein